VIGATVFDWLYHAARWTWHDPDGYNFISGPLADITLIGGAYAILRRHNCHVHRCWHIGRHQVPGTPYVVCRQHNPAATPTAAQVHAAAAAHRDALEEAWAAGAAAVHDVRHAAQEVVADVHQVAKDVHDSESSRREHPPSKDDRA
jgi:hypothetical protein